MRMLLISRLATIAVLLCLFHAQVCGQAPAAIRKNTVITSKTLEYDYKRSMAVFETNVEVVDPVLNVKSEKLTILFEPGGGAKSATATGNVNLTHDGSRGVCRKAIYLVKEGELILMGDVVLRNGDRVATCEKANYYVQTGQVKLTGQAVLKRPTDTVRANEVIFQIEKDDIESVKATGNVQMEHNDAGSSVGAGLLSPSRAAP